MLTIAGLDLAWTPHHPTGVCLVRFDGARAGDAAGGVLLELSSRVVTPEGMAAQLADCPADVIAAVDAPLVIGAGRTAEPALARVFGRAHASAYSANEAFLAKFNGLAGPLLMARLAGHGFEHGLPPHGSPARHAIEVFPHATHVSLFALERRLGYKKGPIALRREAMREYQRLLRELLAREWPWAAGEPRIAALLAPEATAVRGVALKAIEDQLDALTCAYAGWHVARYGADACHLFGDALTGLIVVPKLPVFEPVALAQTLERSHA